MKRIKKIFFMLTAFAFILFIKNNVNAASISASPANPTKGQSVTITVSVPNVNTVDLTATVSGAGTSGTIRLVDGSMTGDAKTFSKSITVTPTSTGTIEVSISSSSNAVLNGEYVNVSGSKNITVVEQKTSNSSNNNKNQTNKPTTTTKPVEEKKSSDNTLSALSVAEGAITPEFSKDVKEYALTIPYEIVEVNVTATPTDSKATVAVEGNKELKEGENTVIVKVTAEDGTTAEYVIKVTRARVPLALSSLLIRYENQEGQIIEIPLNPTFDFATLEYTLQDLEYWVEKLSVEAVANIEGATIDIQGADKLQTGENAITITLKIAEENTPEGEEPKEEIITYTIKVNKLEEPTLFAKIKNWFKGIMGTVGNWFNNNQSKIILGALALCIVALVGLSIYIVVDYNKYKDLIAKVKKVSQMNENIEIVKETEQNSTVNIENESNNDNDEKPKRGKHF